MTASVTWTIRCDRIVAAGHVTCGAAIVMHAPTAGAARRTAAVEGWTASSGGKDACPMHSGKAA